MNAILILLATCFVLVCAAKKISFAVESFNPQDYIDFDEVDNEYYYDDEFELEKNDLVSSEVTTLANAEGPDSIPMPVDEESPRAPERRPSVCRQKTGYVASQDNCNRFYICEPQKTAVMGLCPPGLWFDADHSDAEDNEVVCVLPEVICATDHTTAYQYCNCSTLYPTLIAQANGAIDQEDPLLETSHDCIIDNELHLFPSAVDCERYFICHNGRVFRMQCKPGFHFNAAANYCDVPNEAGCQVSNHKNTIRAVP